jgi:hypothetical protein
MVLSWCERAFVRDGIEQDMGVDGRAREDYRSMTLELGVVPQVRPRPPAGRPSPRHRMSVGPRDEG